MKFLGALASFILSLPSPLLAEAEDEFVLFDDMLIEKSAIEDGTTRGAVKLKAKLWEDGVLPLDFDKDITADEKARFMSACRVWEQAANVRCIEGSYNGRDLKVTTRKLGCFSLYGMGTNFLVLRRWMNLERGGCWRGPTIIHELGHAFGLIHEHQRPDRDEFVTIHRENVAQGFLHLAFHVNFEPNGGGPLTPYDFLSIMHYSRKAFSKNGQDTIVPKPEYREYIDQMGRGDSISAGDAAALAALYGPPVAP